MYIRPGNDLDCTKVFVQIFSCEDAAQQVLMSVCLCVIKFQDSMMFQKVTKGYRLPKVPRLLCSASLFQVLMNLRNKKGGAPKGCFDSHNTYVWFLFNAVLPP